MPVQLLTAAMCHVGQSATWRLHVEQDTTRYTGRHKIAGVPYRLDIHRPLQKHTDESHIWTANRIFKFGSRGRWQLKGFTPRAYHRANTYILPRVLILHGQTHIDLDRLSFITSALSVRNASAFLSDMTMLRMLSSEWDRYK